MKMSPTEASVCFARYDEHIPKSCVCVRERVSVCVCVCVCVCQEHIPKSFVKRGMCVCKCVLCVYVICV